MVEDAFLGGKPEKENGNKGWDRARGAELGSSDADPEAVEVVVKAVVEAVVATTGDCVESIDFLQCR